MKVGIGISSHNRPEVLEQALKWHRAFLPEGAKLVIVDDASSVPIKGADFRFEHNAGISAAKNKCIELLEGSEHIFLSDDDCFPKTKDWHLPYINSGIKHLSFTFPKLISGRNNGRNLLGTRNGISSYGSPCGCMLYIHRSVIDKIGGFDVDYPQWGFEHVDYSNRAFNAKLTPQRYLDVAHSLDLFHSLDYHQEVAGSVPGSVRSLAIPANRMRFAKNQRSFEKMPYKPLGEGKNVLLAAYLNSVPDPQRKHHWEGDVSEVAPLLDSCNANGVDYRLFHDCLDVMGHNFVKVAPQGEYAPNVYRWFQYFEWLKENPVDHVFMVDSTDVEVLRNPFQALNYNKLYTGDEYNMTVDNYWMRKHQEPHLKSLGSYRAMIQSVGRETLPNCGIVGGGYDVVMEYLSYRVELHEKHTKGVLASTDMAIHNYILARYFKGRITQGLKVNTRFKMNEYNGISLFRHK